MKVLIVNLADGAVSTREVENVKKLDEDQDLLGQVVDGDVRLVHLNPKGEFVIAGDAEVLEDEENGDKYYIDTWKIVEQE